MITDIGSTIQCSLMPKMYCQISTDSPNDEPNESATVPTMTRAAIKLRVMSSMMMKIRQSAPTAAIHRSYLAPSLKSLYVDAVPAM